MINEVFDDDAAPEVVTPKGDFSRTINGHEVWFRRPSTAKAASLERLRTALAKEFADIKKIKDPEQALTRAWELSTEFDETCLDFIERLVVDPVDIRVINRMIVRDELTIAALLTSFFGGDEVVDDDAEPVRTPRKKAANARRTRR